MFLLSSGITVGSHEASLAHACSGHLSPRTSTCFFFYPSIKFNILVGHRSNDLGMWKKKFAASPILKNRGHVAGWVSPRGSWAPGLSRAPGAGPTAPSCSTAKSRNATKGPRVGEISTAPGKRSFTETPRAQGARGRQGAAGWPEGRFQSDCGVCARQATRARPSLLPKRKRIPPFPVATGSEESETSSPSLPAQGCRSTPGTELAGACERGQPAG